MSDGRVHKRHINQLYTQRAAEPRLEETFGGGSELQHAPSSTSGERDGLRSHAGAVAEDGASCRGSDPSVSGGVESGGAVLSPAAAGSEAGVACPGPRRDSSVVGGAGAGGAGSISDDGAGAGGAGPVATDGQDAGSMEVRPQRGADSRRQWAGGAISRRLPQTGFPEQVASEGSSGEPSQCETVANEIPGESSDAHTRRYPLRLHKETDRWKPL